MKAPGSERLKLKCDDLLSNAALNFNLRRYIKARGRLEAEAAARPPPHVVRLCMLTPSSYRR